MRSTRILKMMAGLTLNPQERMLARAERKLNRQSRRMAVNQRLVELIERRQNGDDGTRPMPLMRNR